MKQNPSLPDAGFEPWKAATEDVQALVDEIQHLVEKELGVRQFRTFVAVKYQCQDLAGRNCRVKVNTDGGRLLNVAFHQDLMFDLTLASASYN